MLRKETFDLELTLVVLIILQDDSVGIISSKGVIYSFQV